MIGSPHKTGSLLRIFVAMHILSAAVGQAS